MGELSYQDACLSIRVGADEVEILSERLWQLGTLGIEERSVGMEVQLIAGFDSAVAADFAAARLKKFAVVEEFASGTHLDHWRNFATIYRAGNRLVVKPPWVAYEPNPVELIIWIDSGRAFGSGSHPSTRLALAELEQLLEGNESLLDVGCGSGILSVAAARLGAIDVLGIDIDPSAMRVTEENARANGVEEFVRCSIMPLEEVDGSYDVVVANMLASTLIQNADVLIKRVRAGGRLVISGILESQIGIISEVMKPLKVLKAQQDETITGSWVCLCFG